MRPQPRFSKTKGKITHMRCGRKQKTCYKTERDALKGATILWCTSNKKIGEFMDLHAYKCPDCGWWHIGHISKYEMKLQAEAKYTV